MKIDITGRQIEVTPALKDFAEDKLGKLEKLLVGPVEAHVVLAISKHRHIAEIKVKSPHVVLSGTEETGDLYASIGEVVDKLERQALKQKEKWQDRRQGKGVRDHEPAAVLEAESTERGAAEAETVGEGARTRIVKSERYRLKPMSAEDAVLELEATQEEILVFRAVETDRINVVYRQRDGNFGLIDPES